MKVCFVGAGSIGRRHIRNLYHLLQGKEITIDLLRSGNGAALNFELTSYIHKIYTSIDDLDPDYDAIFITNPTSCHFSSILQLQHLTKSFFVEKPVFNTTQINLEDSGIDLKKLIYVAAPMRYTAIIQYIKQHLDMSQALSIRCICSTYLPNWHQTKIIALPTVHIKTSEVVSPLILSMNGTILLTCLVFLKKLIVL